MSPEEKQDQAYWTSSLHVLLLECIHPPNKTPQLEGKYYYHSEQSLCIPSLDLLLSKSMYTQSEVLAILQ